MSSNPLHSPLDQSRAEIRLLEVVSSGIDATLECKLHVVSLEDRPKFAALSYVWGDAKITEDILVDGRSTPVTTTLATALRYVKGHWQATYPDRDPNEFRLWANGLCINQADLDERQSQVQLMRSIYSDAELMISWLGCGIEGIDVALKTLALIAEETQRQQDEVTLDWIQKYPGWFGDPHDPRGTWSALSEFSRLPYWSRVWIFQELVLAQRICFAHGVAREYLEKLLGGARWLRRMRDANDEGRLEVPGEYAELSSVAGWFQLARLDEVRQRLRPLDKLPGRDVEYLFIALGDLQATDPRDHVYGLLGILEIDITPDYRQSLASVCHSYVDSYIKSTKSLRFLIAAGIGRFDPDSDVNLPSWAPDFAQSQKYVGVPQRSGFSAGKLTFIYGWSDRGSFQASGYDDLPRKDGSVLQTVAYLPARIVAVGAELSDLSYEDGTMFEFVCGQVNSGLWSSHSLHHPVEQIFRALVPDSIMESEHGVIPQALAFLMVLLKLPWDLNLTEREQMVVRMAQLGFPLHDGFASRFLRFFRFQENTENVDYVVKLLEGHGYIGNHHTRVLKGLWSSQVFFRFGTLGNGYVGLVPRFSRQGDVLAIVKGCTTPLILREKDDHYVLVGPCFVYGYMCGEAARTANLQTKETLKRIKIG